MLGCPQAKELADHLETFILKKWTYISGSESSVTRLLFKLTELRFVDGGGRVLLSSGRPRAAVSTATLSSSSRSLRLFLFACPGNNFFIPLLPDLLLASSRLWLEFVLFLDGDLSRFIDPTELLN